MRIVCFADGSEEFYHGDHEEPRCSTEKGAICYAITKAVAGECHTNKSVPGDYIEVPWCSVKKCDHVRGTNTMLAAHPRPIDTKILCAPPWFFVCSVVNPFGTQSIQLRP
jgi:hypothetical protein